MENKDVLVAEKKKKSSLTKKLGLVAVALACLAAYLFVPPINKLVNDIIKMFQTGNFSAMRSFIAQYGPWAMLVSSLLMIFQSLAAPLPAFFITLTNANLFGWWQGCILSFVSSMAGAALCFYIARILGRDVVEKICTKGALKQIEDFFAKYGKRCILVARLLPFISFDVVSYAAGLTAMDFWGFFIATGIGQMPACIVYSYVGGMLTGGAQLMFTGLLCLFALFILVAIFRSVWAARQKAKEEAAAAAGITLAPKTKIKPVHVLNKVYNTSLWAMTISMLLGMWAWLGMLINMGWIFYGLWLVLAIVFILIKKLPCGWKFTTVNLIACGALNFAVFGMDKLKILPAARVREGIMMYTLNLGLVNTFIMAFLVIGFALILLLGLKDSKKKA